MSYKYGGFLAKEKQNELIDLNMDEFKYASKSWVLEDYGCTCNCINGARITNMHPYEFSKRNKFAKKTCETYTKGNIAFSKRNTFARKKVREICPQPHNKFTQNMYISYSMQISAMMVLVNVFVIYALYKHFPPSVTCPLSLKQDERKSGRTGIWESFYTNRFFYHSHPQCRHFSANEYVYKWLVPWIQWNLNLFSILLGSHYAGLNFYGSITDLQHL